VHLSRPDEALKLVHLSHAAAIGAHLVSAATTYDRLHALHTVLESLYTSPGVTELRDRLTTTGGIWP
jgi:hypothetical protein